MKIKHNTINVNKLTRDEILNKDDQGKIKRKKKEIEREREKEKEKEKEGEMTDESISLPKRHINKTLMYTKENKHVDLNNPNKKYKLKEKNKYLNDFKLKEIYEKENFEFMKLGNAFNIIGKGAYSEVLLAKNLIDQKFYAIKKVKTK
jgi:hypothetical protein